MMDSNKDEAKKCYNFAKQHLETGRLDRAEKFIRKSLALFPTPEAEGWLPLNGFYAFSPSFYVHVYCACSKNSKWFYK